MGDDLLFAAPVQSRETDERYTPAWIFEALGETFDLDPASPPLGVSRVPTAAVWTKDDDGLTQPWNGFVWCNPPFSVATPWADRFIAHGCGIPRKADDAPSEEVVDAALAAFLGVLAGEERRSDAAGADLSHFQAGNESAPGRENSGPQNGAEWICLHCGDTHETHEGDCCCHWTDEGDNE